jgi:dimeric dUTPase (all-alpha-NTP-PPase superfamily)
MDKLDEIFSLQKKLDKLIIEKRDVSFNKEEWVKNEILAIMAELTEILNEVNYKWWKTPKKINEEALKEEVIDVVHFVVSLCLKIGITPEELYKTYVKKNLVNIKRQEENY